MPPLPVVTGSDKRNRNFQTFSIKSKPIPLIKFLLNIKTNSLHWMSKRPLPVISKRLSFFRAIYLAYKESVLISFFVIMSTHYIRNILSGHSELK